MNYLRNLWTALDSGWRAGLKQYRRMRTTQRRAWPSTETWKQSHQTRKANKTSGPVEGGTVVPLAGPQEISQ